MVRGGSCFDCGYGRLQLRRLKQMISRDSVKSQEAQCSAFVSVRYEIPIS